MQRSEDWLENNESANSFAWCFQLSDIFEK